MKKIKLLWSFLTFLNLYIVSQNETAQWYFGSNAGLNFLTNPPSILLNSNLNASEGSTAISDTSGNFLFSSDGVNIFNQNQLAMLNSGGLLGNTSSSQSSIIVKKPGSSNFYYLFTNASHISNRGFRFNIIDMSLAAGTGSVILKNAPLYTHVISEKLSATKHCNGNDVWVMIHDSLNNFQAYLVTASGVNTVPVVSSLGTTYYLLGNHYGAGIGCMKFSSNGKKLGVALYSTTGAYTGKVEVYDFDNSTGLLSNLQTFDMFSNVYDCEFSPDGTKLYSSGSNGINTKLIQWNLCAGSNSAIAASQYTVISSNIPSLMRAFQRANNGKIYCSNTGYSYLGLIDNPNSIGSGCNFLLNGQSLAPDTCNSGLPNFVSSYIKSYFNYVQDLSCNTLSFSPPATVYTGTLSCSNVVNTVNTYQWNFGDPASGPSNTSSLSTPVHVYSTAGTYSVQLVVTYNTCAPDTFRQNITITSPSITINSTSVSCNGLANSTISVSQGYSNGQYTYSWMPGALTGSVQSNLSPGVYTVSVKAIGGTCISTVITSINPSLVNVVINTTLSCSSASAQIVVNGGSGNYTYLWSPNSGTSSVSYSLSPGFYTVIISDTTNSCSLSQTVQINSLEAPTLSITGNYSICTGNSASLTASGAHTYSWSTGATGPLIIVSPSVSTIYNVIGTSSVSMCSNTKSVSLIVSNCLGVNKLSDDLSFRFFPNPNSGILNIENETRLYIRIHNLFEEVLFENYYDRGSHVLDLSQLGNGVYIMSASVKNKLEVYKIVKTE